MGGSEAGLGSRDGAFPATMAPLAPCTWTPADFLPLPSRPQTWSSWKFRNTEGMPGWVFEVWPFRPFSRASTAHRAQQGPIPGGTGGSKWPCGCRLRPFPPYGSLHRCPSPEACPFRVPSQNWQKRWPQRAWRQTGQGRGPLEILPAKDGGHLGPSPGRQAENGGAGGACWVH